jgi:DNA mismatch repair protein MSH2
MVVWTNQERSARDSAQDPWKRSLEYFEFIDDARRFTNLDQLLLRLNTETIEQVHLGSVETIKNTKNKRLLKIIESLQVFLEERHENSSCNLVDTSVVGDYNKMESTLQQLLLEDADVQLAVRGNTQLSNGTLVQQGLQLFFQAQGWHSQIANDETLLHTSKLQKGLMNSHLVMDRTAAESIHLLPPPNQGVASVVGGHHSNNSLYGLLSKPCLTKMGKEKLGVWLRQPLVNLEQIQDRQDAVTDLLGLGKDAIRDALRAFSGVDMAKLANTLGSAVVNGSNEEATTDLRVSQQKALKALYQLYLLAGQQLPDLLAATEEIETPNSAMLREQVEDLKKLVAELERASGLVEAVLDLDLAPREYLVKASYSEDLQDLHRDLEQINQAVEDELESMQQLWADTAPGGKPNQVRLEKTDDMTWQFRLPDSNSEKTLNTMGNHIRTHRILKNGVYFSTTRLRQNSARYQELMEGYNRHSKEVVVDAMSVAITYQTVVERAAQVVAVLDVMCGLAHTAAFSPHGYCKPTLTDSEDDGLGIEVSEIQNSEVNTRVRILSLIS